MVLGAGMAGLGAYWADRENVEIYEQDKKAGGLCSGFEVNGFHFDQAVHLSFTENEMVRKIFDRTDHYTYNPVPYSWYHNRWLQHPAQNNLYPLSAEEKVEALKAFVNRRNIPIWESGEENFEDWNRSRYGDYLWENLFRPYNEKYWCISLKELGIEWIGNRIYQPTLDEILYGSYTDRTPNVYYAQEMRYPCRGGYVSFVSQIIQNAEKKGKIHYRKKAVKINPQKRQVFFEDGQILKYDRLFSSIPLPQMMDMVDVLPQKLKAKSRGLEHTGIVLVSVGMKKANTGGKLWFYIYDKDILAARAYYPSMKAPSNAPVGCVSIQFEIYYNGRDNVPREEECINNCLYAIGKLGIAEKQDILFMDYRVVKYGNVIFKKGTEKIVGEMIRWLQGNGIIPIGRFGRWEYLWSDQAFMSGYNMIISSK